MNKVTMYLSCPNKEEKKKMAQALNFLYDINAEGKKKFLNTCKKLFSKDVKLDFAWDNGRYPEGTTCKAYDKTFHSLILFNQDDLTEQMINVLGTSPYSEYSWRYLYAISLCEGDRELYIVSFMSRYVPNWNNEFEAQNYMKLKDVDFPILKEGCPIYKITACLHSKLNEQLIKGKRTFIEGAKSVSMVVKDQHGNYTTIKGNTLDDVFRDYANNYTGYCNYRRQTASEWVIVNEKASNKFKAWKETAKGLVSDFDKFYGGGIVD